MANGKIWHVKKKAIKIMILLLLARNQWLIFIFRREEKRACGKWLTNLKKKGGWILSILPILCVPARHQKLSAKRLAGCRWCMTNIYGSSITELFLKAARLPSITRFLPLPKNASQKNPKEVRRFMTRAGAWCRRFVK